MYLLLRTEGTLPAPDESVPINQDSIITAVLPHEISSPQKTYNSKSLPLTEFAIPDTTFNDTTKIEIEKDNSVKNDLASVTPAAVSTSPFISSQFPVNQTYSTKGSERLALSIKPPGITDELQNVVITGAADIVSFVSNPLRWDSKDILNMALVASGTLVLLSLDKPIHRNVTNGGTPSNSDVIKFGHFYGETNTTEYTVLGVSALGLIINEKKVLQLGLELYESYLIADNITGLLKYSIGRSRPYDEKGPYEFRMFDRPKRYCALPSGHSTLAFSMSTILASYTDNDYLKIIIYTPAFVTAFARIYENAHWASDVFLGAAIGHFVARFIVSRHNPFSSDVIQFALDQEGRPGIRLNLR